MKHDITFEQLKALGFDDDEKLYATGGELEFKNCGFVDRVFVSRAGVAVGTYEEAIDFQGVENEHDLKTLIMLLYGEKRQTNDHGS